MDLVEITGTNLNNDNLGGANCKILAIEWGKVTGVKWPAATGIQAMAANNVVDISTLVFEQDAMVELEAAEYTTHLSDERSGEHGSAAKKHILKFILPKNNALNTGFDRAVNNAKLVFFVQQANGELRIQGNDIFPAVIEANPGNQQPKPGDGHVGFDYTWSSYGPGPQLILVSGSANVTLDDVLTAANSGSGSGI